MNVEATLVSKNETCVDKRICRKEKTASHLMLPDTFAGVLREKKYLRAVLNATTINYISIQS